MTRVVRGRADDESGVVLVIFAIVQQLNSSAYCNGTSFTTTHQIADIVQQLVDQNGSGIGTKWTAQFLNSAGHSIGSFTSSTGPSDPPPGSCGVSVNAKPSWTPFFAGIFGIHQFQGFASGSVATVDKGPPIGILALNKVGPHEILGGGTGTFVVSGNIFLNTDVSNQPWTSSFDSYSGTTASTPRPTATSSCTDP
jgi:hypothetical protein